MSAPIDFPEMRDEIREALRALSDPVHQQTRWGRYVEGVNYYDDLTVNVHILYDDTAVLPDPANAVGSVILEREVPALRVVGNAFGPLLHDIGDRPDSDYLADPRWPLVVQAARAALNVMNESE